MALAVLDPSRLVLTIAQLAQLPALVALVIGTGHRLGRPGQWAAQHLRR